MFLLFFLLYPTYRFPARPLSGRFWDGARSSDIALKSVFFGYFYTFFIILKQDELIAGKV